MHSIIVGNSWLTVAGEYEIKRGRRLWPKESQCQGQCREVSNTNFRYRFAIGACRFANNWNSYGPAHHCAMGHSGHFLLPADFG